LRIPVDLSGDELTPVDEILASFSPASHLTMIVRQQIAFITILNFPFYTLTEKTDLSKTWSRRDWAYARMGDASHRGTGSVEPAGK